MPDKFNELLLKQDIIELYNAGITPDYGYLMNGRFEKDMIKTLYPLKTLSGNPISREASDTEYLFPVVSLEPKQEGTGDPSPENVRPISGYDSVKVTQTKDETHVKQITLTLPETIYGGTVDAATGVGSKEWRLFELNGETTINTVNELTNTVRISIPIITFPATDSMGYCNIFPWEFNYTLDSEHVYCNQTLCYLFITKTKLSSIDVTGASDYLAAQAKAGTPVQVTYKLATPEPFQATGNQALTIQPGNHTIYTDGNNISLSRKARRLEV